MRNTKKITYDKLHSWQYSNNIKSKITRWPGHIHHSKGSRGEKLTQSSCGEMLGESLEDLGDDGRILQNTVLGAFAKSLKATISFVMSVRLSVHPHRTTGLPLDEFSWNVIIEYFSKICQENSSFIKIG